ncbi:MAG: phage antirepressor protein, partial [Epsilonproteobacteria bacterium]|nr:phage antirepressor protein [Campylobacterota bacterium]
MSQHTLTTAPLLDNKQIRKIFHKNEWWFSVLDFIAVLAETDNVLEYWQTIKINEKGCDLSTICRQLKLTAPDGKKRETDCANTEGIFR